MYLRQLPSGAWRVAVKRTGERRTGTAPTRGEAQRLGAELVLELGGGGRTTDTAITVADMLHAHLAEKADDWSPTYRHDAGAVIDKLVAGHSETSPPPSSSASTANSTGQAGPAGESNGSTP